MTATTMPKSVKDSVTARGAALELLGRVLDEGAYTNIAVNQFLRCRALSAPERRLLTELVYGTVKALGTLDWYLRQCVARPLANIDRPVLHILRLSLYQLLYLDRIPPSAACNEAVKLARAVSHEGAAKFVNGVLRGFLRRRAGLAFPREDEAAYLALAFCHPRWLIQKWLQEYGREETEALCRFNNSAAPVSLRANTLVTSRDKLLAELRLLGAEAAASEWSPCGIVCRGLPALEKVFASLPGAFYVQDESSMLAAQVLDPRPGETVIDLCSAPGGKATHLAQLMENRGVIHAGDIYAHKLRLIEENAKRLGIGIIRPCLCDATVPGAAWLNAADRVLVDAPCSGLGVLRRRAEARWRRERDSMKEFPPLQLQILTNAAACVKKGGRLVYSTCTIEQAENHYLVREFLAANPQWDYAGFLHPRTGERVDELQLLPQRDGIDGFYICALKRRA